MKRLQLLVFLLAATLVGSAQEYIVFDRQIGLNNKQVLPQVYLSQNEIVLGAADTTLHLFNLYFCSDTIGVSMLDLRDIRANISRLTTIYNDVLVTAVPVIDPGDKLKYSEINKAAVAGMKVVGNVELLKRALSAVVADAGPQESHSSRATKTFKYKLIIKSGEKYLVVSQPVLLTFNLVCNDFWYFPNEFRKDVLNTYYKAPRFYSLEDFKKMIAGTEQALLSKKLHDRTYVSGLDSRNEFGSYVFSFWEYQNDDYLYVKRRSPFELKYEFPGLGSFTFLPKVGIINCTMDYYLKEKLLFDQKQYLEIKSINAMNPQTFGKVFSARLAGMIRSSE